MTYKIYLIECNKTGLKYIGSTTTSINKRIADHIYDMKRKNTSSKKVLENKDYNVKILKEFNNIDKKKLLQFEDEYIQNYNCVNYKRAYKNIKYNKDKNRLYRINRDLYEKTWGEYGIYSWDNNLLKIDIDLFK